MPNEIPKLNIGDADNRVLVGECLFYFINNHPEFQVLLDESFQKLAKKGQIELFCKVFFKAKPKSENLVPWFMDRVFSDLAECKNATEDKVKSLLDKVSTANTTLLEIGYKINEKYNLDPDEIKRDMGSYLSKLSDDDKANFLFSFFGDIVIHLEIIIISTYYEIWFGKPYVYSGNDSDSAPNFR